jgi:hypothetical protein
MGKKKAVRSKTAKKAPAQKPGKKKTAKKSKAAKSAAKKNVAAKKPATKKRRGGADKDVPAVFKQPGTPSTQPAGRSREEWISELAYFKWQSAGCPHGDGANFWAEAEADYVAMYG